ncbi:MAG: YigZ family protein [Clostridia bacterium]|nr:YigZ family protein [Clostridia bacterium]
MAKDKGKSKSIGAGTVPAAPVTYTTLAGIGEIEFVEKKSVFLGYAAHVESEEAALEIIRAKKKEMPDATHHVYGYTMKGGILARYSDDGEPQGTAGMPVLESIRQSGADDALVIVTRYFGGTLLGAGGLVRAYAHSAALALQAAGIVTYETYAVLGVSCSYSDYQRLSAMLPRFGAVVDDVAFADEVSVTFAVKEPVLPDLDAALREMSAGVLSAQRLGERFDYR